VDAVDNDPVAVENALADVAANGCTRVHVEKGDIASVRGRTYGIILANIERNTLVAGMHDLAGVLSPGGYLLLSGFIVADVPVMREAARAAGLETVGGREEGEWAMLTCSRKA
jgi:ribosomal protein L11 methyltransferase